MNTAISKLSLASLHTSPIISSRGGLESVTISGCSMTQGITHFLYYSSQPRETSIRTSTFSRITDSPIFIDGNTMRGMNISSNISVYDYNVIISSCYFNNCTSTNGGAIYANDPCTNLSISNSLFTNCYASILGGAIYSNGTLANFTFLCFEDDYNGIVNWGAAIYASYSYNYSMSFLSILNCPPVGKTSHGNVIGLGGGSPKMSNINITNGTLINDGAMEFGSAEGGSLSFSNLVTLRATMVMAFTYDTVSVSNVNIVNSGICSAIFYLLYGVVTMDSIVITGCGSSLVNTYSYCSLTMINSVIDNTAVSLPSTNFSTYSVKLSANPTLISVNVIGEGKCASIIKMISYSFTSGFPSFFQSHIMIGFASIILNDD